MQSALAAITQNACLQKPMFCWKIENIKWICLCFVIHEHLSKKHIINIKFFQLTMYRYIFDMRSNECLVTIGWKYYRYKGHNLQNPGDGSALPLELRITANTAKREEEADCNLLLMKIQFLSPLLHIIASPYIVWYFNSGLLLTKSIVYVIFEYCNVQINFFLYFKKIWVWRIHVLQYKSHSYKTPPTQWYPSYQTRFQMNWDNKILPKKG